MSEMPPGPPDLPGSPRPGQGPPEDGGGSPSGSPGEGAAGSGPPGEGETPPAGGGPGTGSPPHGPLPGGAAGGVPPGGGTPPREPGALDLVLDAMSRGWRRMAELMFRGPYANVRGWLSWGFVVLLAGAIGGGGPFQGNFRVPGSGRRPELPEWLDPSVVRNACSAMQAGEVLLLALAAVLVVLLVLVILWLSSVFRFVLYDDVRAGRPEVREPFRRHLLPGLGYFAFRLLLGLVVLAVVAGTVGSLLLSAGPGGFPGGWPPGVVRLGRLVLGVLAVLAVLLGVGLAAWFVHDLVLPIHVRDGRGFRAAFRTALRLAGRRPLAVLLFGLARLLAGILATIAIFLLFCATCCLWAPPLVVFTMVLVLPTVAFWPLAIVTVPLLLAAWFGFRWLAASAVAPWPVFVRAWALAFVEGLAEPTAPPAAGEGPGPAGA